LLQRYIDIQIARFGDRLTVVVNVDRQVLGALVPSLLLQPLVENAIRHGLASRSAPGRIEVRGTAAGDRLIVEVSDDGLGLERPEAVREGVGVGNTRARLQELYGADASFDMRDRPTGGVSVIVTIPLREAATP
jgi:two-component system LytT family sensor kinase